MKAPTDFERLLLRLILQLTEKNDGRPPTLAELTLAAGLRRNSRSYVQRILKKLRPVYVTWSSSARSLRVTSQGLALLAMKPEGALIETPVADVILPLLASGLTQMCEKVEGQRTLQAPYPASWQRGLNILAVECLLRGVTPPAHTPEAMAWCRRPLSTWPVRLASYSQLFNVPLLDDEEPTIFCRELALISRNVEHEWCENKMARVRDLAITRNTQGAYVAIRKYLIDHAVVSQEELMLASFQPEMDLLGEVLYDLYEIVPMTVIDNKQVLLCGFCGWTLQRVKGRLRCGDDRCRTLTADFTKDCSVRSVPDTPLMRVREPIRRYVVAPGKYEVRATRVLRGMGLDVELWPGYDRYDLRLVFPDGHVWAVDVKDWRYPHLLVRKLIPLRSDGGTSWDRAFYAVPDERLQDNPDYLAILQSATANQPFEVVTIGLLIKKAHSYKEALDA